MSHIVWPNPYNPTFEEHQRIIEMMTNTTRDYPEELFDQKAAEEALRHLPVFVVGFNRERRFIKVKWSLASESERMPVDVAAAIVWDALKPVRKTMPGVNRAVVSQTTDSLLAIANNHLDIIYHE